MMLLADTPCSLLLLGLITLAALVDWGQRRRCGGGSVRWQRPVAHAFLGAGVFFILTVWLFWVWMRYGVFDWIPSTPIDEPSSNLLTGQCIRFLPACAGAILMLPDVWCRGWPRLDAMRGPVSVLAKAALTFGLAGALGSRWVLLDGMARIDGLAPYILRDMFGMWLFPSDLLVELSGRGLALAGLELFAQVALILWLFQLLWVRATSRRAQLWLVAVVGVILAWWSYGQQVPCAWVKAAFEKPRCLAPPLK